LLESVRIEHDLEDHEDGPRLGNILVVDDEPLTVITLKRQLEDAGFAVAARTTAGEALKTLEREPYDVLVTDLVMPRWTG